MSRWQFAFIGALVLGLAVSAGAQEKAKYVKIVQVATGKVLAIENDSDDAEAKAVTAKDEANPARQWKLEKDGAYYKIVNRKSGKVLDVNNQSKDEGGGIIQWEDKTDDNDNQRWQWKGEGEERRLVSKHSGLVLDTEVQGEVVQKKADEKAKNQLWRVVEIKE